MAFNFGWVVEGRLAAAGQPGGGPYGPTSIAQDLALFRQIGIGLIVSLTEEPLDDDIVRSAALSSLHLPVPDMTPPPPATIDAFLGAADTAWEAGHATLIHCRAGLGRTGTMAACFLVREGLSATEAIGQIRALRPGSIETPEQELTVHDFAARFAAQRN